MLRLPMTSMRADEYGSSLLADQWRQPSVEKLNELSDLTGALFGQSGFHVTATAFGTLLLAIHAGGV
jgi:hypothetical protein